MALDSSLETDVTTVRPLHTGPLTESLPETGPQSPKAQDEVGL